jgi:hypothetical protein
LLSSLPERTPGSPSTRIAETCSALSVSCLSELTSWHPPAHHPVRRRLRTWIHPQWIHPQSIATRLSRMASRRTDARLRFARRTRLPMATGRWARRVPARRTASRDSVWMGFAATARATAIARRVTWRPVQGHARPFRRECPLRWPASVRRRWFPPAVSTVCVTEKGAAGSIPRTRAVQTQSVRGIL